MGYDLALTGAAFDATGAKYGQALSGGYGTVSGVLSQTPASFTMECWVKTSNGGGTQVAAGANQIGWLGVSSGAATARYGSGTAGSGGQGQYVTGGESNFGSGPNIADGNWHHLAMTVGSSGGVFYVDGQIVATVANPAGTAYGPGGGNSQFGVGEFGGDVGAGFAWSGEVDEAALWSTVKYTGNFTPSGPIANNAGNLLALWHLDGNGTDSNAASTGSGAAPAVVAANNAALVYSPYNWNVTATAATTVNAGAAMRTLFSGSSCTLGFNIANNAAPLSEIWYRIDGEGPWTMAPVAASIACAMPAATVGNADLPYHLLELVVKSTTETQNRWNTPSATAVVFTGLTLDAGASVVAPLTAPLNILCYGDSITEGVRTLGELAANDTDRNDAMLGWAFRLGALLGAEIGVVGFGASGLTVTGSGNVPPLPSSYALLYQGVARAFSPVPNMVIFNEGTNDGSANTVAAMVSVLNGVIASCPGCGDCGAAPVQRQPGGEFAGRDCRLRQSCCVPLHRYHGGVRYQQGCGQPEPAPERAE